MIKINSTFIVIKSYSVVYVQQFPSLIISSIKLFSTDPEGNKKDCFSPMNGCAVCIIDLFRKYKPRGVLKVLLYFTHTDCFGKLFGMLPGSYDKGSILMDLSYDFWP